MWFAIFLYVTLSVVLIHGAHSIREDLRSGRFVWAFIGVPVTIASVACIYIVANFSDLVAG